SPPRLYPPSLHDALPILGHTFSLRWPTWDELVAKNWGRRCRVRAVFRPWPRPSVRRSRRRRRLRAAVRVERILLGRTGSYGSDRRRVDGHDHMYRGGGGGMCTVKR